MTDGSDPNEIVQFWSDAGPAAWFKKDAAFDETLRERFLDAHMVAARRELDGWLEHSNSTLALLLLLDQFPRNLFRGTAHAFATDPVARWVADKAVAAGHDRAAPAKLRAFFYLPFEHSERPEDQERSVALFAADADHANLKWAKLHQDIITKFGRFPHRNAALGRESSAAELAFLSEGGFSG